MRPDCRLALLTVLGIGFHALGLLGLLVDCSAAASRPPFDRFREVYYLGWQERTRIAGVSRSVFNLEVSGDGANWERKYRFETVKSFQYPTFREHAGTIYLSVTQGDSDPSRKERIRFGRLE